MLKLDHLAVAARTSEERRAFVENALGVTLQPGGQHARYGAHNLLAGLEDGLYLEVISVDPDAPVQLQRGDRRWKMAVPQDGRLPHDDTSPALIERQSRHPAPALTPTGARC